MELAWRSAIVAILLAVIIVAADGLQNVRVVLPPAVRAGSSATLLCLFDLEGAPLYSVKWYRGRREFFRYLPGEQPPSKVFRLPGVFVDLSASGARQVTLQEVPSYMSGEFSCEVSADAPSFSTAIVSADLNVVDFAGGRPVVTVEDTLIVEDVPLVANCTAEAQKVEFYINNVLVDASQVVEWPGGATLVTFLERGNFSLRGELRIKCVASIGNTLKVSSASVMLWWAQQPFNFTRAGSDHQMSCNRLFLACCTLLSLYSLVQMRFCREGCTPSLPSRREHGDDVRHLAPLAH